MPFNIETASNAELDAIIAQRDCAPVLDPRDPMKSARQLIDERFRDGGHQTLYRHRGTYWHFSGCRYHPIDEERIRRVIWCFLEGARTYKQKRYCRFVQTDTGTSHQRGRCGGVLVLPRRHDRTAYVADGRVGRPTAQEFPVANGLLHLPTAQLLPASPAYFATSGSEVTFNPSAPAPIHWLQFLSELFGSDNTSVELLQDSAGYCSDREPPNKRSCSL